MNAGIQSNTPRFLSTGELARRLGLRRCQLIYLVQSGVIPEPALRAAGKRLFSLEEAVQAEQCLRQPVAVEQAGAGQRS